MATTTGPTRYRFCLRCFHRAALPISYGLPCRPPDREVRFANRRGRGHLWVYEDGGRALVNGGCRSNPAPPGAWAWVRAMRQRYLPLEFRPPYGFPPSFGFACLRCGRRFGVSRWEEEADWDEEVAS
jgi:hypothetical protein